MLARAHPSGLSCDDGGRRGLCQRGVTRRTQNRRLIEIPL